LPRERVARDPKNPTNQEKPICPGFSPHQIDPSFVITHKVSLDDDPRMYKTFRDK
jgi:hypothetical protein